MTTLIVSNNYVTLQTYQFRVRRLLHDSQGRFYPNSDINDYINQARERIARDTGCLRRLITGVTLLAGQEAYSLADTVTDSNSAIDVMGVSYFWGTVRQKLGYLPWTAFDARMRYWTTYRQRPLLYSRRAPGVIYVGPTPDQNYASEWDVIYIPSPLANPTDTEELPNPFTVAVPFYAAYLAKQYEQSFGESEVFKQQYDAQLRNALATYQRRTVQDPYYVAGLY